MMSAAIVCRKRGLEAIALGLQCRLRGAAATSPSGVGKHALLSASMDATCSSSGSMFCSMSSQLVKTNGKRAFLVDTLALVRRLEAHGVPSKYAEAITEVLNDSLENVAQSIVTKSEMQKIEMIQDVNIDKFKYEVKSSQEHRFSLLQREIEKMHSELKFDINKMCSEVKFDIDKMGSELKFHLL